MKRAALALFATVFSVVCWGQQSDYTIVVLPDTQYYSAKFPATFKAQTQWIVDHKATDNIQLVIGVGDIVDGGGSITQWTNADVAVDKLDGVVPYVFPLGNHDYDKGDKAPLKRLVANFNKYFGPSRYQGKGYYGGNYKGSNENFFAVVTLGGKDTLIVLLEFNPRPGATAWAKNVIQNNQDKPVIIATHTYGYGSGRISTCDSTASEGYGLNEDNDGQELWDNLVSQYANITMVLSGHVTAFNGVGRRSDFGINGNRVNQIVSDYQAYANGGNGYLRIMRFHPSLNRVDVETYSPTLNTKLTDGENQFSLTLKSSPSGTTASISGNVTNNTACSVLSGVTISDGNGHSTLTDASGNYTLSNLAPGRVTLTASKSGFFSQSKATLVQPGKTAAMKFSLKIK
jgi:hypothetical protein